MLTEARLEICRKYPFLAPALGRLEPLLSEKYPPSAVDGAHFFCCPDQTRNAPRLMLHGLLHCLLGHPFLRDASPLACDLAVALVLSEAAPEYFPAHGDLLFVEARRRCLGEIRIKKLDALLAEDPFLSERRGELARLVAMDDHSPWQRAQEAARIVGGSGLAEHWHSMRKRLPAGFGGKNIGREAGVHREHMILGEGDCQKLADYLRRYAVEREYAREDPDSFEYAWYAYGIEHYGNMPLIEPTETREERRLEELVIAIDTSSSCERGLTRRFLEQTRSILLKENLFFRRFNLHILQCDAKLQRDDKITTLAEFERYISDLEVCGGGGTDFCPVFAHIDRLIERGELKELKGMLYFTDGRGVYPSEAPKYETTFVFLKHRYDDIDTPRWAKRLVLDAPMPKGNEYMEY